jgi:cyclase
MLAKRIIPTVLVRGKTAYKGPGFGPACTRSVGSALAIYRTHARRGVDELLILDIGATPDGRGPDLDLVRQLSDECFIPITVGGGVKTIDDIDQLLRAGADKVAIGAAWRHQAPFLSEAVDRFGAQALVGISEHEPRLGFGEIAIVGDPSHVGELVLQSRDRESGMGGYAIELARVIGLTYGIPLIVSGGCSGPQDMIDAIQSGADAVAAGALFQFTDTTPKDCARYLKANGIEVRL